MSGVCGHSKPVKPGEYVIFATGGYGRSYVHQFFEQNGIAWKDLDGCFEDAQEESYIVHADDYDKLQPVIWSERAVLWLGPEKPYGLRDAWVRYREGTPSRYLGEFTRVTKERARRDEAWTYDPSEGAHYVCIKAEGVDLPLPFKELPEVAYAA